MDELPNRAGATLGTTDPPRHDRLRALISHAFTKRNLESLATPIRATVRDAIEEIRGRHEFDFVGDFSSKVTAKILFRMLGLPEGDDQAVRERAVLMVQSDALTRQKGPEHIAAYEWMMDYAAKIIAERRSNPGEDLLSQFFVAEIDGERLAEREVLLTTTTLIMAGVESLGGFTVMFGLNLADYPEARRELIANPALIPDAVEESLRFNTSGQRFRRRLMKDVSLHGQTMQSGDFVCLAYGAANRDERQFPDPDRYDIIAASRARTWVSAEACTPAWARWWRAWRCGSRSRNSCRHSRIAAACTRSAVDAVDHVPQPDAAGSRGSLRRRPSEPRVSRVRTSLSSPGTPGDRARRRTRSSSARRRIPVPTASAADRDRRHC
jgi:hypothetical protein